MMNKETICAVVRDLLPSYIDGLTEGATNIFIEQHLTECETCRAVKRSMQQITSPAEQAQAEFLERLRRARMRRKKRAWIIGISILLILAVCFLPLPISVNQTVQAVKWRAGHPEQGSEPIEVKMKGIYLDFLFLNDYYNGDIMIEGLEISQREGALSGFRMFDHGSLFYADEEYLLQCRGLIVGGNGFKEFVIALYDYDEEEKHGAWSGDDGTMITWPAVSREDAVETTKTIARKYCPWLANSRWEGGLTKEEYSS